MTPREKQLTVWHISYLIYQAIFRYISFPEVGVVAIEIDDQNYTAYRTNINYLKTVHDLKTKIHKPETRRH